MKSDAQERKTLRAQIARTRAKLDRWERMLDESEPKARKKPSWLARVLTRVSQRTASLAPAPKPSRSSSKKRRAS